MYINPKEREIVHGRFYDAEGRGHDYAYTAVGFVDEQTALRRGWARDAELRKRNAAQPGRDVKTAASKEAHGAGVATASTKREHEVRHRASGAAAAQCDKLRAFLRLHHPQNWTRKELSRRRDLGMDINVICARVDDIRDELEFVHRSCSVTAQNVQALRLKVKQLEPA